MDKKNKILFYTIGTKIMPSSRARIYIYENLLKKNITYKIIPAISNYMCKIRISGKRKTIIVNFFYNLNAIIKLIIFLVNTPFYNYIVVQKILFPRKLIPFLEFLFSKKKCYFDVDDLIYKLHQNDDYSKNKEEELINKFQLNLKLYNNIIVSTNYLKNEILQTFNLDEDFIIIVNNPIDIDYFSSSKEKLNIIPVIGWIGTPTNTIYLKECLKHLKLLKNEGYNFKLSLVGANKELVHKLLEDINDIIMPEWTLENEKDLYDEIDIGLMPLPNDEWSLAKAGYKLLLYMSMGKLSIASNVGINKDIIDNNKNGFLIKNDEDWYSTLKYVLNNYDKSQSIRVAARQYVEKRYSLNFIGKEFLKLFY